MTDDDFAEVYRLLDALPENGSARIDLIVRNKHDDARSVLELNLHADNLRWRLQELLVTASNWRGYVATQRACRGIEDA